MEINFFWIGESINKLGQLTLKSFLDNNHQPVLWVYNKDCKNIPLGTIVKDAGEILNQSRVFSYKGNGDCRNGSYGGFSDIFRYYLLQKVGGWYCDMDVTCLNNFSDISENEYCFRKHKNAKYVGNIMKCPKNSDFLKFCIEETEKQINCENDLWVKPVFILSQCIEHFKLQDNALPNEYFGCDDPIELKQLVEIPFKNKINLPKYAIHWCNEFISTGYWDSSYKRDWNTPIPTTLYYKLLKKHKLL